MSICSIWRAIFFKRTTVRSIPQISSFAESQGIVIETIKPNSTGRVRFHGVSWLARCAGEHRFLPVNTPVQVVARSGLVLIIRPVAMPASVSCCLIAQCEGLSTA